MQELEFKRALADEMAAVPVPPMISETEMLAAGRRARQRRRATLASAGSAVAVVALIMAVAVTASKDNKSEPAIATTNPPATSKRGGQTTATAGPHYDRGITLLDTLVELVPPGFEAPPSLTYVEGPVGDPLRNHFASAMLQPNPEDDQWSYYATIPVTNVNGIAQLSVWVYKPPTEWPNARGCALSESGWRANISAGCQEVTVADTSIGVVTERLPTDGAIVAVRKWASYRHSDGTVVFLEQADGYPGANFAWMNQLPLTDQQFAELATDPRFNLD